MSYHKISGILGMKVHFSEDILELHFPNAIEFFFGLRKPKSSIPESLSSAKFFFGKFLNDT